MTAGTGRWRKIKDHVAYVATVKVLVADGLRTEVELDCRGDGFAGQGVAERATANGYEEWKRAARNGASYAVRVLRRPSKVTVTDIVGATTDTTPGAVAAAAAQAVFDAAGESASPDTAREIERVGTSANGRFSVPIGVPRGLWLAREVEELAFTS